MKRAIHGLVLLLLLAGCSKTNDVTPVVFTYSHGRYTQAQLDADVKLREFLFRETIRNRNGDMSRVDNNISQLKMMWRDESVASAAMMISAQLQMEREDLRPTGETKQNLQDKYVFGIANKHGDFASLRKKAGEAGVKAAFDLQFERDLAFQTLKEDVLRRGTGFSETNVWIFLTNATNAMLGAEAKNVEIYQMASNAVKRLRAGEDFNGIYEECCNLEPVAKEDNLAPAEYDESDFSGEDGRELWETLKALPDGSVSEVLETDEGLVIYKILEHVGESERTQQFALKMGKIVIRRVIVQEIPSVDKARKMVRRCLENNAIEQKMKAAMSMAQIDFGANATNLSSRLRERLEEMGVLKEGGK